MLVEIAAEEYGRAKEGQDENEPEAAVILLSKERAQRIDSEVAVRREVAPGRHQRSDHEEGQEQTVVLPRKEVARLDRASPYRGRDEAASQEKETHITRGYQIGEEGTIGGVEDHIPCMKHQHGEDCRTFDKVDKGEIGFGGWGFH